MFFSLTNTLFDAACDRTLKRTHNLKLSVAPGQVLPDTYDVARYLSQAMPYATRCTVIDRFEQSFKKTTTVIEHEDVIRVQFLPLRS